MDIVHLSIYTIVTACDQSLAVIVGKTWYPRNLFDKEVYTVSVWQTACPDIPWHLLHGSSGECAYSGMKLLRRLLL
jgi:hypothetical protein